MIIERDSTSETTASKNLPVCSHSHLHLLRNSRVPSRHANGECRQGKCTENADRENAVAVPHGSRGQVQAGLGIE